MGTVIIGFNHHDQSDDIPKMLETYIVNNSSEVTSRYKKSKSSRKYYNGYNSIVEGHFNYEGKTQYLCLIYGPQYPKMYQYKLTFHQSQWVNQLEVVSTLVSIWGLKIAHHICFKGIIVRLDTWLDLEIPYNKLSSWIYKSFSQTRETLKSKLYTTYIGSLRSKNYLLFYEKKRNKNHQLDLKLKNRKLEKIVRIENRFIYPQVPIKHYSDYSQLYKFTPFQKVKTYILPNKTLFREIKCSEKTKERLKNLINIAKSKGLFDAIRLINKNNDFHRTIKPILEDHCRSLNLDKRFKRKIKQSIVADFKIKNHFDELFSQSKGGNL